MSEQKSLKKNFIMNALLTASTFLFPLITFPYISRVLGPEGCGKVSLATAVVSYFLMISQLGIPTYGIRACAKVRDNRDELSETVCELLLINLVMAAVSYLLLGAGVIFVPKLREEQFLYLVISSTILCSAFGMEWLYKGLEQYTYLTVRSILFKAIALAGMFLLVHETQDYVVYGGISVFAICALSMCCFLHARKLIFVRKVRLDHLTQHLRPVLIFFAMTCATTVYTNLDKVMLGFMTTDTDVGYYHAAVRIKDILVSLITSLGVVLLPRASYYLEHEKKIEFQRLSRKAIHFVVFIALPISVYFLMLADKGIFLLSGRAYAGAITPMRILMPTLVLIGLTNVLGMEVLVPMGREHLVLLSVVAGAVVDLVINIILIPGMAASGAAIGTLIAEVVVLLVQCVALRDELPVLFADIRPGKLLAALVIGAMAAMGILQFQMALFPALLLTALLFFGGYFVILLCLRESMAMTLWDEFRKRISKTHKAYK